MKPQIALTNAHKFNQQRAFKFKPNLDEDFQMVRGDAMNSIVSIGDNSIVSPLGPSTPKSENYRALGLATTEQSKKIVNFNLPKNFELDGRLLAKQLKLKMDFSEKSSTEEYHSDTQKEHNSKEESQQQIYKMTAIPQFKEFQKTQALTHAIQNYQPAQTERQRNFIPNLRLESCEVVDLTIQSDRDDYIAEGGHLRTDKTISPVSVRHSKHKQPIMYVARFSKQTQLRQKIMANKLAKKTKHNLSQTERQYTLPIKSYLIQPKQGLNNEAFVQRLIDSQCVELIDVSHNQISQVPHLELSNHSHFLLELNLSNNKIRDVPEETFRSITLLEVLNLSANELKKLPDSLFSLYQLHTLDVSLNKITVLSPKVSLLTSLKVLFINDNKITELPNSLSYLRDLLQISSDIFIYLPQQQKQTIVRLMQEIGEPDQFTFVQTSNETAANMDWYQLSRQKMTLVRNHCDCRFARLMLHMQASSESKSLFLQLLLVFTKQQFEAEDDELTRIQELIKDVNLGFAGSLLHCLAANNHVHLLEDAIKTIKSVFEEDYLSQVTLQLQGALRQAVNAKNNFDQTPLEVAIVYQYEQIAEEILTLLGDLIDIDFKQPHERTKVRQASIDSKDQTHNDSICASNDQSIIMKPGNHQSELLPAQPNSSIGNTIPTLSNFNLFKQTNQVYNQLTEVVNDTVNQSYGVIAEVSIQKVLDQENEKIHPLVITLANSNFGVSCKLLEVMYATFVRKYANYQQFNKVENRLFNQTQQRNIVSYDLNCVDTDGLSFLHHLFANFSKSHDKAVKFFKLMIQQTSVRGKTSMFSNRKLKGSLAQSPTNTSLPNKALLLNQVTNFGETPFALAIEHQQNSAVDFAVQFNIQQLQIFLAQTKAHYNDRSSSPPDGTSFWNTPQAKLARNKTLRVQLDILRSPSPRAPIAEIHSLNQIFDLTEQRNVRQISPVHRAVLKSNYFAVNSLLQSAITIRKILQEKVETKDGRRQLKNFVPKVVQEQIVIDVFQVDSNGRSPREYALKMVFMSKLLRQAETNQIWSFIKGQSPQLRLDPLLPTRNAIKDSQVRMVGKKKNLKAKEQSHFSTNLFYNHVQQTLLHLHHKQRQSHSVNRQPTISKFTQSTLIDPYRTDKTRACSKGVKKAKSMAFNSIQYRAESSSQLSSASQLLLSQRFRITSQVNQAQNHNESNEYMANQNVQINLGDTRKAMRASSINKDEDNAYNRLIDLQKGDKTNKTKQALSISFAALTRPATQKRNDSPIQKEQKIFVPFSQQNAFNSTAPINRQRIQAPLPTTKGKLPVIARIVQKTVESLPNDSQAAMIAASLTIKRQQIAKVQEERQDPIRLEDLEDDNWKVLETPFTKGRKQEETIDGFNFDDSSSDEDIAALPSIQNEYTLKTKSFYTQKRPYIQQISTNTFESDFYQILGEMEPKMQNQAYSIDCDNQLLQSQQSFLKIERLYNILSQATTHQKLQDAKDVFDFLIYEIENQSTNSGKMFAATGKFILNQAEQKQFDSKRNNLMFLKDEIKHLRMQLDLLTKQMISLPNKNNNQREELYSDISSFDRSPVETPNMNDHSLEKSEGSMDDNSFLRELNPTQIKIQDQLRMPMEEFEMLDITDLDDCSEKVPYYNSAQHMLSQEEEVRQETILRSTVNKSPNLKLGAIEVSRTPQRMPSVSQYIPQLVESSKASFLSNQLVVGTARASVTTRAVADQQKRGSGKTQKLQQLLEPAQTKNFAKSQINVNRHLHENVETEPEGGTNKNRPLISGGLQSFSKINKDIRRQVNTNSPTERESLGEECQITGTIDQTEAVLEETPIQVTKMQGVKVSQHNALPGSFTDRYSYNRSAIIPDIIVESFQSKALKAAQTPMSIPQVIKFDLDPHDLTDENESGNYDELINESCMNEIMQQDLAFSEQNNNIKTSSEDRLNIKQTQSILVETSDANTSALGFVRRHAAASRMSERQFYNVNKKQQLSLEEQRKSLPQRIIDIDNFVSPQLSSEASYRNPKKDQQLIILLGEDSVDLNFDRGTYESNYSSAKPGPKKLHQTTVVLPAGFSLLHERNQKTGREGSVTQRSYLQKAKKKTKLRKPSPQSVTLKGKKEKLLKGQKHVQGNQIETLNNNQLLPPRQNASRQALQSLARQKKPVNPISAQKPVQKNSTMDAVKQIQLQGFQNNDLASQSFRTFDSSKHGSVLFGPSKKPQSGMVSQKTAPQSTTIVDQKRQINSVKPRNSAPAIKPAIKIQLPKHSAKNEPTNFLNPKSPDQIKNFNASPIPFHKQAMMTMREPSQGDRRWTGGDRIGDNHTENQRSSVLTIHLGSFGPAKLTGQQKKKNQRAPGTQSALFGQFQAKANETSAYEENKETKYIQSPLSNLLKDKRSFVQKPFVKTPNASEAPVKVVFI